MEDRNQFAELHHEKIIGLGYWETPREIGTLLMLIVTEITKLFDINKLNKPEKLADIALRIYDYCGYYKIDLTILPDVIDCGMWDMCAMLTNELEAYRVGFNLEGFYIKHCLSMTYRYAELNHIDLDAQITRKSGILHNILKRLI